jgi:hypothetical protein
MPFRVSVEPFLAAESPGGVQQVLEFGEIELGAAGGRAAGDGGFQGDSCFADIEDLLRCADPDDETSCLLRHQSLDLQPHQCFPHRGAGDAEVRSDIRRDQQGAGRVGPADDVAVSGIRTVDEKLIQLGSSYGLTRWGLIRHVVVPGAMPMILTGIRYALGVAWLTLVVAETIATREGIGYLAQNGREMLRTDRIVLAIVLYAFAGLLADQITRLVERRALRWNPTMRKVRS